MLFGVQKTLFFWAFTSSVSWAYDEIKEKEVLKGFPSAVLCSSAFGSKSGSKPEVNDTVLCSIQRADALIFNDSITWADSSNRGYFFDAADDWRNVTVAVSATWARGVNTTRFSVRVTEPTKVSCAVEDVQETFATRLGESETFACRDNVGSDMSEEQFNNIETIWYKQCVKIEKTDSRYTYVRGRFSRFRTFMGLRIHNATFEDTPGNYHCALKYKEATKQSGRYKLCVDDSASHVNAVIVADQKEYLAVPGEDLDVGCSGQGGKNDYLIWEKEEKVLCRQYDTDCTYDIKYNKFCKSATEEEIKSKRRSVGAYSATFKLRNLTYEDSGVYRCTLVNYGEWVHANFTVNVREHYTKKPGIIIISLAVMLAAVAAIAITLFVTKCRKMKK